MAKIFSAADAAESAVGAVIGAFFVGHPEVADGAVVFSELDMAVDAAVTVLFGWGMTVNNALWSDQKRNNRKNTIYREECHAAL